jgi:hypothetical protein
MFGRIAASVIWSDSTSPDGELLVPIDPHALADDINANGFPLLKGHDPGYPLGRVVTAQVFVSADGSTFIAAIVGFYSGGIHPSFREFGFDPAVAPASPPSSLPALPGGCWITLASDPREIEAAWIDDVLSSAPLPVERVETSHNAAETLQELIRLGLPYLAIVWNPYVKTIATEAGKDTYAALHQWFRGLLAKVAERHSPLVELKGSQGDCHVSFLFRGTDVERLYAAHEALSPAAVQAAQLIENMKKIGHAPVVLVYEFKDEPKRWFPSYAELGDGTFVTDNNVLIAVEQLPSGLSLGITRSKNKPLLPAVKRADGGPIFPITEDE